MTELAGGGSHRCRGVHQCRRGLPARTHPGGGNGRPNPLTALNNLPIGPSYNPEESFADGSGRAGVLPRRPPRAPVRTGRSDRADRWKPGRGRRRRGRVDPGSWRPSTPRWRRPPSCSAPTTKRSSRGGTWSSRPLQISDARWRSSGWPWCCSRSRSPHSRSYPCTWPQYWSSSLVPERQEDPDHRRLLLTLDLDRHLGLDEDPLALLLGLEDGAGGSDPGTGGNGEMSVATGPSRS